MIDSIKHAVSKGVVIGKQHTYNEITDYLDKRFYGIPDEASLNRMKMLDTALGNVSQKIPAILVAGTNGKSLTIYFTAQLLKAEGLKAATFYAPHLLTYNERFAINNEFITNKQFIEIANEVIGTAESLNLDCHAQELLTMIALLYFAQHTVDVALFEVAEGGSYNPVNICHAKVATITRVTAPHISVSESQLEILAQSIAGIVKTGTHVVCGDQNKNHLSLMQKLTESTGGTWAMPIRKLAALPYPFEQLHGRCAALAERTAQLFVENFLTRDATVITDSLLTRQRGMRGRPTIEQKRRSELYPKKTLEQFWKEMVSDLPGRFQLLDKEKPSILLDTAHNLDAFKNLLLGIRLLHYQRPLKGLSVIVAAAKNTLFNDEFLKMVRYFFKKTSGQLFICPLNTSIPGNTEDSSWDVEQVTNEVKTMKVKSKACKNFEEAFEWAKKSVDERNGLIVITGSQSIIREYWKQKGIKKL